MMLTIGIARFSLPIMIIGSSSAIIVGVAFNERL
jgi:hypothetical protein